MRAQSYTAGAWQQDAGLCFAAHGFGVCKISDNCNHCCLLQRWWEEPLGPDARAGDQGWEAGAAQTKLQRWPA